MNADRPRLLRAAAVALAAVSLASASMAATTTQPDPLAGLGTLQKMTATVTVKSVDPATRHLVVTDATGKDFSLKAPSSAQNLAQLKPGDRIKATYALATEFALSPPNGKLPPNTQTVMAARAAKGDLPAGVVANHIVITGAIIGIDMTNHTLKIVNPKGGMVHTISVQRPEGRAAMAKLKVGDYVTAYITEALLISTTQA